MRKPTRMGHADVMGSGHPRRRRRRVGADDDQVRADYARRLLHAVGIVPIEPDDRIAVMLEPGEQVVATREAVTADSRLQPRTPTRRMDGDLYLTDRRLLVIGADPVELPLDAIREVAVVDRQLLVLTAQGGGLTLELDDPIELRVQLAAARRARRELPPPDDQPAR